MASINIPGFGYSAVPESPNDGQLYGRRDATWELIALSDGVLEAPADGTEYVRKDLQWVHPTFPTYAATDVTFTATNSQLLSDNVHDALEELYEKYPRKMIFVRSSADFPTPQLLNGVMTHKLEEYEYVIDGDVEISASIGFPGPGLAASLRAVNRSLLMYTGTDAMFHDLGAQGTIEVVGQTEFQAPNGDMFNLISGAGGFSFQTQWADRFTNCNRLGEVYCGGLSTLVFNGGTFRNFNQGLIVHDPGFFEVNTFFMFGNNQAGCKYFTIQGESSTGSVNIDTVTFSLGTNETIFDFNQNIQDTIDTINVRSCTLRGPLNGTLFAPGSLTPRDRKFESVGNTIIGNTVHGGLIYLSGNVTQTVVTTINTPTKAAGTWITEDVSHFNHNVNGALQSEVIRDISSSVDLSVSVQPASGNGVVIRCYLAKNGVVIPESAKTTTADNGKAGNLSISWHTDISQNDYFELYVENRTGTTPIIVTDATLRIP
ncbi:hypothetical protein VPFG_00031 [Vibrio phage nt-1]|uniref:Uncharacterized protein n=1 Tax=Vibrio phage nt-1 TaxID=115992 RepID=R9TE78_9CAUD|nr:hypothetical protein VPFG_00031 [Vibrio phage nt-1]AGN30036.1 hypothetical protein VPFG_00031 [Vibrio phage nt-1]